MALNQVGAAVFLAFGAAILTLGAGLVIFAATLSVESVEKSGESLTLFELIGTEFGWRGWILIGMGGIVMIAGFLFFTRRIENLK